MRLCVFQTSKQKGFILCSAAMSGRDGLSNLQNKSQETKPHPTLFHHCHHSAGNTPTSAALSSFWLPMTPPHCTITDFLLFLILRSIFSAGKITWIQANQGNPCEFQNMWSEIEMKHLKARGGSLRGLLQGDSGECSSHHRTFHPSWFLLPVFELLVGGISS